MSDLELELEARRWWRYANEDLWAAGLMVENADFAPRLACALAQQAVEKGIKAALVCVGIGIPRHHNLNALRNLLPDDWLARAEHPDLSSLTYWAVEARYPGDLPDASQEDAIEASSQARAVLSTLAHDLLDRGFALSALTGPSQRGNP